MKKTVFLLCLFLLLTGCGKEPAAVPVETVATEMVTVPQTEPVTSPEMEPVQVYSQEMAMLEGFVVMQDGDVRHNAGSWFAFLDQSLAGEVSEVTIIQFTQEVNFSSQIRYDVSFDGGAYFVTFERGGKTVTKSDWTLMHEKGTYDSTMEPFDCYEAYSLCDIVLYRDMIAAPDYEGVTEIYLHDKEGEPPIKSYAASEEGGPVLQLLMEANWVSFDTLETEHIYGMKLLMTNRDGKELVIELDLNYGYYRYGMQTYCYGEVEEMLEALGLDQWPDSVLEEFASFIK